MAWRNTCSGNDWLYIGQKAVGKHVDHLWHITWIKRIRHNCFHKIIYTVLLFSYARLKQKYANTFSLPKACFTPWLYKWWITLSSSCSEVMSNVQMWLECLYFCFKIKHIKYWVVASRRFLCFLRRFQIHSQHVAKIIFFCTNH